MPYRAFQPISLEPGPLPRARIAVTRPGFLNGNYLFELVDVNGPRRGHCLATVEVNHRKGTPRSQTSKETDRQHESLARTQLQTIGQHLGYAVSDF